MTAAIAQRFKPADRDYQSLHYMTAVKITARMAVPICSAWGDNTYMLRQHGQDSCLKFIYDEPPLDMSCSDAPELVSLCKQLLRFEH